MEAAARLYEVASGALRNALLFVEGIPAMRVIYSLVLLAVIVAAGRELYQYGRAASSSSPSFLISSMAGRTHSMATSCATKRSASIA